MPPTIHLQGETRREYNVKNPNYCKEKRGVDSCVVKEGRRRRGAALERSRDALMRKQGLSAHGKS
ncbi:hypothetical protein E2C01_049083 [Portunus trituberculatus]|uniref:Uncharacterized protein n=1 Tax=Portunus trituberculatus TaxID=210409 RepID=A0A5B7GD00_PORTR|nr:hypothetical protein [Portunus trituberculatus]